MAFENTVEAEGKGYTRRSGSAPKMILVLDAGVWESASPQRAAGFEARDASIRGLRGRNARQNARHGGDAHAPRHTVGPR